MPSTAPEVDFSRVSAAYTAASYTTGDPITVKITGDAASPDSLETTVTVKTKAGDKYELQVPSPGVVTKLEPVDLDTVTDSDGRTWTISEDGKTASSVV